MDKEKQKTDCFYLCAEICEIFLFALGEETQPQTVCKEGKDEVTLTEGQRAQVTPNKTANGRHLNVHNTLWPCSNIKMTFLLQLISDLMASTCIPSGGGGCVSKSARVHQVFTCYMRCCDSHVSPSPTACLSAVS